jgi:hypothetical protein
VLIWEGTEENAAKSKYILQATTIQVKEQSNIFKFA